MSETTLRPQNVLGEILEHKRNEVKSRREGASLEAVRSKVSPTTRSLVGALRAPETGFVLECKRRSPSAGTLREPYDPVSLAAAYAPFASAISVLVDERFFGGSFEDLRTVRSRVDQPVLLKDFIVDPYQVYEARMYGADAVLLLLSVLDDERLRDCLAACRALGMDALCETVNADEIDRAVAAGASLIGINHRDLRTLEIDRSRVRRLASRVPSRIPLLAESAIACRRDVLSLQDQVDGFLIGGSLMREPGEALHRKLRSLIFGKTKICGLSRPEDARQAFAAGATHLGVVLAPSPRRVDPDRAAEIFASAPAATRVAVFVNEDHREIQNAVKKLSLDIVQLHGDERADEIAALRAKLPPAVGI